MTQSDRLLAGNIGDLRKEYEVIYGGILDRMNEASFPLVLFGGFRQPEDGKNSCPSRNRAGEFQLGARKSIARLPVMMYFMYFNHSSTHCRHDQKKCNSSPEARPGHPERQQQHNQRGNDQACVGLFSGKQTRGGENHRQTHQESAEPGEVAARLSPAFNPQDCKR